VQLRRLEVENIRSYEAAQVEFGAGTTLIVGDVGAGKTSLLYAVEMALFGAAEVDSAYLVRHGAAHAEVTVRFEDGKHEYEVSRRLRRVRRKGRELFEPERITFMEDGRPTSYSATEVRQRVIELLGFPDNANPQAHSDLWRWAIYVPQERMRDILSAKPQDRLETVRKALGVERYKIAAENAQLLAADLRAGARHSREEADRLAHWDGEFAEATQAADRMRVEREALERGIVEKKRSTEEATARLSTLRAKVQDLEADRRETESLVREEVGDERGIAERRRIRGERFADLGRRRVEAEEAKKASLELPAARARWDHAEEARVEARQALERHSDELQSLATARADGAAAERRASDATGHVDRALREREEARAELETALAEGPAHEPPAPTPYDLAELERRLLEARARDHAALEEVSRARGALGQVDELLQAGVCPTCHQSVRAADFGPHRAEAAAKLGGAEEKRRLSSETISGLEEARKSRERFERAHDRWATLETRRATGREALARREAALRGAEAAKTEAITQANEALGRVERLRPVEEEGVRLRSVLEQKEAAASLQRAAVEQGTIAEERARSAEAALQALSAEVDRLEKEIAVVEARRSERSHRITQLRERLGASEGVPAELKLAEETAQRAEARLNEDKAALVRVDTRLDGEVRRAALAEKGRAERSRLVVRAGEYDRMAEWASAPFRLHVLAMERDVLAHAQASFDRDFSRFFAALVDDPGLVARTNPDFTPEVAIEGDPTPAEALSGGERTSLALAFRLALATVVRSLGAVRLETLILDEPTDGFSSEQMIRMGELFDELHLPQVIVVSHETQLMSIADRSLRVRKEDGRSTVAIEGAAVKEPGAKEPGPPLADVEDPGEPAR
jgi:DNA repair protein SbcC/Rad50